MESNDTIEVKKRNACSSEEMLSLAKRSKTGVTSTQLEAHVNDVDVETQTMRACGSCLKSVNEEFTGVVEVVMKELSEEKVHNVGYVGDDKRMEKAGEDCEQLVEPQEDQKDLDVGGKNEVEALDKQPKKVADSIGKKLITQLSEPTGIQEIVLFVHPVADDSDKASLKKSSSKGRAKAARSIAQGEKTIQHYGVVVEGSCAIAGNKKKYDKHFQTRMSPSGFTSMVPEFNEAQKDAIKSLGFEFFLYLDVKTIPGKFAKWLADNFDPYSVCLRLPDGQKLNVTPMDVHLTLGLPIGGREIVEVSSQCSDEDYEEVLGEWQREWGISDLSPEFTDMPQFILSRKDGGQSFRRNFVLYVVACFFSGPQNRYCPRSFLKNVADVNGISSLNWSQYVVDRLVFSVRQHQEKKMSNFTGPILFLMLLYFDRVVFMKRTIRRQFPAMLGWTQQGIKARISDEAASGGFGKGFIEPPIDVPVVQSLEFGNSLSERPQVGISSMSEFERDIKEMTSVLNGVATAFTKFKATMDYMSKKYPKSEELRKIRDAAVTMLFECCDVKSSAVEAADNGVVTEIPSFGQDDDISKDPRDWQAIDSLLKASITVNRRKDDSMPSSLLPESQSPTAQHGCNSGD